MKNAPNYKYLPADKATEAIIFAGADAYVHAQHWIESEGKKHGDNVPPVYLGKKQLADLANIRIVDKGRERARVYLAAVPGTINEISQATISAIVEKLAIAGVQQVKIFKGIYDREPETLHRDRMDAIRERAENGDSVFTNGTFTPMEEDDPEINLVQMADNEKAALLAERYEGIAVHPETEGVYVYLSGVWESISSLELGREMVAIYNERKTNFSKRGVSNVIDTLKLITPVMREAPDNVIPFINGVFDMSTGEFSEHEPDNWITNHNGIEYSEALPGENLHDHAPNFHKWLSHAADNDALKMQRIAAALFMILANRHDWQLFLEITGEGGSGKSVFTHIATLLAGQHNTASGNMAALDSARGRAQFVNKRMITLPDQPKYTGEGTGIKAITGGDAVEIDPKNEHQYTAVLRAVVVATNNTPMIFTERAGGVARRRVIFQFNNKVSEKDKDPALPQKIAAEIPVIVRRLLASFANPEDAKNLLLEQRNSDEALEVKRGANPVIALAAALDFLEYPNGMMMGGGRKLEEERNPRACLYHAYLAYMEYMGLPKPLSVPEFGKAVKDAANEIGRRYMTREINGRKQTNTKLNERAEEFL
ncbi:DNA primase [Salmonella enterica subsp. enterica]|nr:DNA primase [Salmonella enterica subsp. enterica]ECI0980900.1 DNA primase [Salmonella enterica subsp. enterica serovar Newport]ECO0902245.1 DNA primase [Salmonella enterica subsp. enterica serovar Newport]ECO1013764.1 DNA primase [Salmonella enterica subsp. enterica serovar Newport]EDQ2991773.1 DNA primase [Salmonella enterica subsp. enterica]